MLAKKSPNDAVNSFKLRFVNSTLISCNSFLGQAYRPFPDFEEFSTDELPSNSDVAFIISQYIECAEKMRADNIYIMNTLNGTGQLRIVTSKFVQLNLKAQQEIGSSFMARRGKVRGSPSPIKGAKHDDLMPLLVAMFRDFQDASKKKPDAALNKRKVEIVNRLLRDVLTIVEGESTRAYLDLLDEDDLPQNSDVVLILGQAVAAMQSFKTKYYRYSEWDDTFA